ncbi:VOC family protein [Ulvibacterium sp.]|uniref:VOC family protein n=1 Tax=Ulvibacterium sp. TaxID=2665914 RepID=UPI003BABD4CA
MNPVVHFEFPYKDGDRISTFYKTVFGWELTPLEKEFGSYILATTAETDAKPGTPAGTINGGFFPIKPDWPGQYPSVVIGVGDIEESMRTINQHGGEVLGEPYNIPNFGLYVAFYDTEGNRNSIIQPIGK